MSKFVLISDLHGNAPALQAVVDAEGVDEEYVILGDIHGLNAYSKWTQTTVKEVGNHILAGNHDKAIFHHAEGHVNSDKLSRFELEHTLAELPEGEQEWMRELPHMKVLDRGGQRIALTHALPWPEMASGYEEGNIGIRKGQVPHIASVVSNDYDWVFHGHTHEQYDLDADKWGHDVHFVNPGSLGYQQTYSVVDTNSGDVSHHEVEYKADVTAHVQERLPKGAPPAKEWL